MVALKTVLRAKTYRAVSSAVFQKKYLSNFFFITVAFKIVLMHTQEYLLTHDFSVDYKTKP